jgi:hypothetical protein
MPDVTNDSPDGSVIDDGHTSGGGSLGHDQPEIVEHDTPTRNATDSEETRNTTGSESDPVMPSDDATLNTKI